MKIKHLTITPLLLAGFWSSTEATSVTGAIPIEIVIPAALVLYYPESIYIDYSSVDIGIGATNNLSLATIEVDNLGAQISNASAAENATYWATGLGGDSSNAVTYTVTNAWAFQTTDSSEATVEGAFATADTGHNRLYLNSDTSSPNYVTISAPGVSYPSGASSSVTPVTVSTPAVFPAVNSGDLQFTADFSAVTKAGEFSFANGQGIKIIVSQQ